MEDCGLIACNSQSLRNLKMDNIDLSCDRFPAGELFVSSSAKCN